ncbi:MAG TPA: stage 0 sporulation family protein [Candidatus Aphodoplasma excrementigallinarum]|uniref:Stage 0 sporulation family protein n=1 Tax=Candidatus Aphodoplasma excrementigallinarum TaxID=2840673 RepID=A0A9D1T101_9FIRM|nr:stage 0 sporulation family protein [Candidatus Aphodoplasma excrementigallinarum]
MVQIVGVRFKSVGKIYYFDPGDLTLEVGASVIVETARGVEMGTVAIANRLVDESGVVQPLKKVVRAATKEDFKKIEDNEKKEAEAFVICSEKIKAHKLEMKLVDVEYTFDGSKVLFYFTADGRIDFRELVKDLASVFRTRIELRQIGVRDEAKMIGSYGICGRNLCCSQFLGDFAPVSIKMAKEQGLSLNPTKISGTCGRLMCCLKYEQEAYEDLLKVTPKQGALVSTPDGKGTVVSVNLLKGKVKVSIDGGKEKQVTEFPVKDVKVLGSGKKKDTKEINKENAKTLEE